MAREYFGTDGVRGHVGDYPLTPEGSVHVGMAIGTHFANPGETILLAHDPRESSPMLVAGLATGLTATGVHAENVGVLPTPGLAYLTRESNARGGVMVSASHNKYSDNGFKAFDANGDKLPDETEDVLNALINNGAAYRGHFGKVSHDPHASDAYEKFLVQSAGGDTFEGLAIGIDTAHGAASGIAARVFTQLGATVIPLFDQPDGRNINAGCGATNTKELRHMVPQHGWDMGIALDGDADRLMMVDEQGREINGDHIMYILAKANGLQGVVATSMTNLGTELAMRKAGIHLVREDVGDRYVLRGLAETGFRLGGEQSGHIIQPDLLATGDGMLAAIQTMRAVRASGKSLAAWRDEVQLLPQSLVNIPVADKSLLDHTDVQAYVQRVVEGLGGEGRVLIRPSGTEPLARVMVESPDAERAARMAADGLQSLLGRLQGTTAGAMA